MDLNEITDLSLGSKGSDAALMGGMGDILDQFSSVDNSENEEIDYGERSIDRIMPLTSVPSIGSEKESSTNAQAPAVRTTSSVGCCGGFFEGKTKIIAISLIALGLIGIGYWYYKKNGIPFRKKSPMTMEMPISQPTNMNRSMPFEV